MVNFWEMVNRSATGPRMGEREWDFQIYYKTQDLVKEYGIKWDGESFISNDNTLAEISQPKIRNSPHEKVVRYM